MTRTLFASTITIALLLAGACAPPPAPASVIAAIPTTTPSAPLVTPRAPVDPTIVSVASARPPAGIAIDGAIGEWGTFVAMPSLGQPMAGGARAASEPAPNPPDAGSRLAFAISGDGALIAASLGPAARDGIWLGVGAWAPDLPRLGVYSRGGVLDELECEFVRVELSEGAHENGPPNPPEVRAACEALIARHKQLAAAEATRFERVFKIDREGVHRVDADGALAAIPGASAAWKATPGGASVEVALPLAAMPRVAEAPLEAMRLAARAVTSAKPPALTTREWVWVTLPSPVAFEPLGDLRAKIFEQQREIELDPSHSGQTIYTQPEGLSYHPATPLRVERVHYLGGEYEYTRVGASDLPLYEKRASLGDVEVGTSAGGELAILKKGKLVEIVGMGGILKGIVHRDGELHALAFSPSGFSEAYGFHPARWSVTAIAEDASHRDLAVDESLDAAGWYEATWTPMDEISGKDFARFGMRTVIEKKGVEETWSWSPARKMYVARRRDVAAPAAAKTKPGKP
jgi:hypothetical protein